MSDIKENQADKPLKKLSRELLNNQILGAKQFIANANAKIANLHSEVEQNIGIIKYSEHLLSTFEFPDKIEEPKKKVELEVK